ncbi:MAG: M17 family metallopeptidase [Gammaproteobacteria bacterium]|nr:M17 family metallopeptidase [Gammaproteobacteria bacterium]MDH5272123.1 M17 family metallopeptidase [Gammaproteobacteria bacterium]
MQKVIPPELRIDVTAKPLVLSGAALSRADGAVVLLEKTASPGKALQKLPQAAMWRKLLRAHQRSGQESPILVTRLPNRSQTLVAVGFVKPGASGFERLELAGKLAKEVLQPGVARLQLHANEFTAPGERAAALEAVLSAVLAHAAPMPEQKSKPAVAHDLSHVDIADRASPLYDRSRAMAAGNHLARWLAALPPNVLGSIAYRAALQELARREGWSFKFYGIPQLEKIGAGAFLAVARANPHRGAGVVRLTYKPKRTRRGAAGIALVGKGICFDTGGINLKPHRGMYTMHGDMQGSSVAVGTLLALTRLAASYPIDCWLAITENEIGPNAFRPQEVVRALNGVTIQVVHSDAEGRMVLADTLTLASREKPRFVLDFATLTGACVNALTDRYAGAFTNRAGLHDWLQQTGRHSGERVWCFPMDEDFDKELECPGADVLQCTLDSKGDHILASRFLSRFVEASVPWVHFDLAPSERKGGLAHVPTEMTGFGVRYAVHLLGDADALDAQLRSLA